VKIKTKTAGMVGISTTLDPSKVGLSVLEKAWGKGLSFPNTRKTRRL